MAGGAQPELEVCAAAQVLPLREAKRKAAGEPGDRPASDSASPDPCPGAQAILGLGCV